jgi:serine/threonine-protein kinase
MLVDDHPLWIDTVRKLLEQEGAKVVAESSDGVEAVGTASVAKPDVVVMDLDLPSMNGVEVTRRLVADHPDLKVLVLSASDAEEQVVKAVRAGAAGYLVKTAAAEEIGEAVRRINGGEMVFPPALAGAVLDALRGHAPAAPEEPLQVGVADDSALRREALASALREAGFIVTGTGGVSELPAMIEAEPPDVAIVAIATGREPQPEEMRTLREIRDEGDVRIFVLAEGVETSVAIELLEDAPSGLGYLLSDRVSNVRALADAVRRVGKGESVIDPQVVSRLVGPVGERSPLADLTSAEREVLALMAEGRSNQAISERLFLRLKTVEARVGTIFSKLGLEPAADDHRRVLAVLTYLRSRDPNG